MLWAAQAPLPAAAATTTTTASRPATPTHTSSAGLREGGPSLGTGAPLRRPWALAVRARGGRGDALLLLRAVCTGKCAPDPARNFHPKRQGMRHCPCRAQHRAYWVTTAASIAQNFMKWSPAGSASLAQGHHPTAALARRMSATCSPCKKKKAQTPDACVSTCPSERPKCPSARQAARPPARIPARPPARPQACKLARTGRRFHTSHSASRRMLRSA